MTTPLNLQRLQTPTGGTYTLHLPEQAVPARLEYDLSPGKMVAKHTFVPDAMRGQGVGQQLVQRLVADARAEGCRIEPRCSYVRALAERHPEWADAFA